MRHEFAQAKGAELGVIGQLRDQDQVKRRGHVVHGHLDMPTPTA